MRRTVERILNGQFDYEKGSLDLSLSRIELTLAPGEIYTGSFFIRAVRGKLTEGRVYSSDIRMELIVDSFSGTESEIGYTFSARGLEEGDVSKGEFSIISNQGEYYLPYVVSVMKKNIESSLGSIKNLFHFTNLAKSDWNEAVKLFYSEEFITLFSGTDLRYKKLYLGLSRFYGNEQNVEEFLLSINKKQPVEYIPERTQITIEDPVAIAEECINITRNGWGYTFLNVESDGDFISFTKSTVTDDDFLGNYLSFPVLINPDNLHGGVNFGKIRFFNAYTSFEVNVSVSSEVITKSELSRHLEMLNSSYDMFTYYEAFRTRKIALGTWLTETGRIVDRMREISPDLLYPKLFKAQLLMIEERYNEAKWILDQAENELHDNPDINSPTIWAYYLYLTTLYSREDSYIDTVTDEISKIYSSDPSDWRVGWMLLYLSEEFAVSPSKKWLFIRQQIETGCISPMFFVEAVNMLNANPTLLTNLSDYEIKVINYAVQNELLSDDVCDQFVYLCSKEKEYSKRLWPLLRKCYDMKPDADKLLIICDFLIKGDRRDEEAHDWYELGVLSEVRATRLYEYYMESMDITEDNDIPKMVFLYFSYESNLRRDYAAYLFAKVIAGREEMPDIYENYRDRIERFSVDCISAGLINRDLVTIYKHVYAHAELDKSLADNMVRLLFTHKITVDNPALTKVVVYQSRENVETVYPIENGEAYVPLYTKDFEVMFEDNFSNRYSVSSKYDLEMLMVPGKLASSLIPMIHGNLEFDVYVCECSSETVEINEETRERYANILGDPRIDKEYKSEVRAKLMDYYYDKDRIRELDEVLSELEPMDMTVKERITAERFLVIRGMYDTAIEWVKRFGTESIEIRDLVKLCSKLIYRDEFEPDERLVKIAAAAFFNGKYDEVVLKYLADNYCGMTKDLRKIFKACENFNLDTYKMCENLILQMLYTGYFVSERMEVYKKYVQGGGNSDIKLAFLSKCSFDYFVKETIMEQDVFTELTKAHLRGEPIQTVSMLAYLKYYSENPMKVGETESPIIEEYLTKLINQGIYMSFFKNFLDERGIELSRFSDKTIIEYKTDPGRRVFIHYIIEGDDEENGEYVTEEMRDMYGGVHAKAFVLFFGENLLYYITEENDEGEEFLTESASIQKSDISREIADSCFNAINDIVIAKTLRDYDTVDNLLYDYYKHDHVVKNMFTIL